MHTLSIKQFCFSVLILSPFFLFAQDFNNYKSLVSNAPIPEEFILSSTEKYERDKKRINQEAKRANRKAEDEFYLENNFVIDDLIKSGSVLFNDPISDYVNKVADELLKADQELRSKLRFYTIKSHVPNAFATDRGSIFVTVGLMAHLNNEAELAYILSHEIVHFVKKHSLNSYVKFEADQSKLWNQQPYYKKLVEKNNYSKELELEADELGLTYFNKSKYSYKAIKGVFDVLAFAHAPYKNLPFEKAYLEQEHFKFGEEHLLDSLPTLEAMDDDDENSTHPAISERRDRLKMKIYQKSEKERSTYIIGQEAFNKVREISKFEICYSLVQNKSYQAAIYHSFLLSKEYPNNDFLKRTLVYSLYGLAQYQNEERESEVEYYHSDIPGESQQAYYMIYQLSDKELSVLATLHAWKYYKEHPENLMYKKIAIDMAEDLVIYQIEDPKSHFLTDINSKDTTITDITVYAFANWMNDQELLETFEQGREYRKRIEKRDAFHETEAGEKQLSAYYKQINNNGKALGLDKVVFVNPFYIRVKNTAKKSELLHIEAEKRQQEFKGIIVKSSAVLDLESQILDVKTLSTQTGIVEYRDIITINQWVKEMLYHDMEIIDFNYDKMLPLTEKYNTNAFAFTGAFSTSFKSGLASSYIKMLALVLWVPPLTPYCLELLFTKFDRSYFFTFVYDVEKNKAALQYVNEMNVRDKDAILKANIFWAMQQMKNKEKTKKGKNK